MWGRTVLAWILHALKSFTPVAHCSLLEIAHEGDPSTGRCVHWRTALEAARPSDGTSAAARPRAAATCRPARHARHVRALGAAPAGPQIQIQIQIWAQVVAACLSTHWRVRRGHTPPHRCAPNDSHLAPPPRTPVGCRGARKGRAHANRTGTGAPVILQLRAPLVSEVDDWQARLPIDNGVDGAKTVTLLTQLPRDLVLFLPGHRLSSQRVYCARTRTNPSVLTVG